ncbi:MAG: peptidase M14 [Flavobacteriaceae bacterium]|nr:peptidase M14 [Flavobacteriaceae bacterium]|tara:strand:- start:148440 stop:149588 length:1149 start_codon:yes stop_codon:yes gene_type:complete
MILNSQITNWYSKHFETRLSGRYIGSKHINPILFEYQKLGLVEVLGNSEKGEKIHLIKVGHGSKKVLAWSQMHGNESTTTKSIFDFLKFLLQEKDFKNEIDTFKQQWTLYVIPILNPDGAHVYTRENANLIDLNRDAQNVSQAESKILWKAFNAIKPNYCFNLHDQRTLYSLPKGQPATISFLAPSADSNRTVTDARRNAMEAIARMFNVLNSFIPGKIGRYDDTFNLNCVGDSFQAKGVPTILFEAGHFPNDYQREKTREYVFYAFLGFFKLLESNKELFTIKDYFIIPENEKNFNDVVLRNVSVNDEIVDIIIQLEEKLHNDTIILVPRIEDISKKSMKIGHKEIDVEGNELLINSHENVFVNEEIATICYKNSKKSIIL